MPGYDYDAVIIGAGISGLVCGCYLAKAGMKVLIVEKNAKPGGYCTSFKRGEFTFDACAHSLGSLRDDGNIKAILRELDIERNLEIKRYDPSDIIFCPDYKVNFWNNLDRTIDELQKQFSRESVNIEKFFRFLNDCKGTSFIPLRHITFQTLLDNYFKDNKLKSVLSLPIFGNAGFSVSKITAFSAVTIYKEFLLDGGYYPKGGMQKFPDLLLKRFKELGGQARLSTIAKKIKINDNAIEGVVIDNDEFLSAKFVISNADARQTLLAMIGSELIPGEMSDLLNGMIPSLSMFILYLGIDKDFEQLPKGSSIWFLPHYDIGKMFLDAVEGNIDKLDWFLLRISEDGNSILRFVNSPFMVKRYWEENKKRLIDEYIKKTERLITDLSKYVVFKDAATPDTLNKWTLNYEGAAYGWAGMASQFMVNGFYRNNPIRNLYLTGHWATLFHGIPGVAYLGRETARTIIYKRDRL
jgi:prolycopene isomerase